MKKLILVAVLFFATVSTYAKDSKSTKKRNPSSAEQFVEFSKDEDLLKLVQAINTVNDGSLGGHVTGEAKIQCTMSQSDRYCTISKLQK